MITAGPCAVPRAAKIVILLATLMLPCSGCIQTAALWANITGGDVVEPQYTLTKGPLLILIDDRDSKVTEPRAMRHVHKAISDAFLEYRVNRRVVPLEDWRALRRTSQDYDRLSIREMGEKLGADQVLYIRVDRFALRPDPGVPLFKGEFVVRVKVLSTQRGPDVRLWPRREDGHKVLVSTPSISSEGDKSAGDVSRELAAKLGGAVAKLFYQYRALDK